MKTRALHGEICVKPALSKAFRPNALLLALGLCAFLCIRSSAQNTYTLYRETIGAYAGSISVASYTGWSSGTTYRHTVPLGTATVTNIIVPSNYPGATGGSPVTVSAGSTWVISGINTLAFSAIRLSFGIHKSNVRASGANMNIEVSSDGITYTTLSWTQLPTVNGSGDTWHYKEGGTAVTGTIPATSNLRIRFRNASSDPYDFDDIHLRGNSALPLQLISFTAAKGDNGNQLEWVTSGESDIAHFFVQGSNNGIHFFNVHQTSARNTGIQETYRYNDILNARHSRFYRLCWVERNGASQYSSIVRLNTPPTQKLTLVSNPVVSGVIVLAGTMKGEALHYIIYNTAQQIIKKGQLPATGSDKHTIPASGLKSGTYFLQVKNVEAIHNFTLTVL